MSKVREYSEISEGQPWLEDFEVYTPMTKAMLEENNMGELKDKVYEESIVEEGKQKILHDPVNHPTHYTSYPGIEVIQLTRHMNFCKGNACKYIARAEFKGTEIQDLEKAIWYLQDEIKRIKDKE
jgi:hypothetical protein